MPPRVFSAVPYLPLVDVRPAELIALQELPEKDKDLLLPVFKLRPWVGADRLEHALNRLTLSFGKRPAFMELGDREVVPEKSRTVHAELAALRHSSEGYKNWVEFFSRDECQHFIPVVQLTDPAEFVLQVESLTTLGRGLAVRIDVTKVDAAPFARLAGPITDGGRNVVFVLDYFKQNSLFATQAGTVKGQISAVLDACSNAAAVAVSASSFPDGFTSITKQDIFERALFNRLFRDFGNQIVYSDRGSARAERQSGGGGLPVPRIDFAKPNEWVFYREDSEFAKTQKSSISFQRQAKKLMESPDWDQKLKLWGCQMIEKTAIGDDAGIISANRATAARINIHLHQQLYYGDSAALYDTDEDWTDD